MSLLVRGRVLRALLALPLLALPAAVHASGFAIESQGARAMGFAGAYVAQAADPSAIYYNAAGIGFLKGKHIYVAGAVTGLPTDFTGEGPFPAAGTLESSDNGLALLPAIYYSQQIGRNTVVGLGVSRPFGVRSKWDNPDDVHRPLHLPRLPDRVLVDQPHDRVQARRPVLRGGGARRPPLEVRAHAPPDGRAQPLPRADRRRRAHPRERHGDRGSASTSGCSRAPPRTCRSGSPTATR